MPWLGRKYTIAGGLIQLVFQSILITSGNLRYGYSYNQLRAVCLTFLKHYPLTTIFNFLIENSFLNWLTMLPAIYCFDDAFLSKLFTPGFTTSASIAAYTHLSASLGDLGQLFRKSTNIFFAALIIKLSVPVVKNLLSKKQLMNASFDPLRLVNSYGAFGTVEEERIELIIQAAEEYDGPWLEYQFKVKPGDVTTRPRFISPYHYRLDWLMWIASVSGSIERSPWMLKFLLKLLEQDEEVCGLLEINPFASKNGNGKPKYIRVEKYRYKFNKVNEEAYWTREKVGKYFPKQGVCSVEMLKEMTIYPNP